MPKVEINNLRVDYNGAGYFPRWEDDKGRRLHFTLEHNRDGLVRPLAVAETPKSWGGQKGRWLYRNPPEGEERHIGRGASIMDALNNANGDTVREVLRIIDTTGMAEKAVSNYLERAEQRRLADQAQRVREIREGLGARRREDGATKSMVAMYDFLMGREDDDLLDLRHAFR
jgi:hypothetical protein